MSFMVPDMSESASREGMESNSLLDDRVVEAVEADVVDDTDGLMEESREVADTEFPTRMTGIEASIGDDASGFTTLKNLNRYETALGRLSDEYDAFSSGLNDTTALRASWDDFEKQAAQIHKSFLAEEKGQKTSRLYGQSFVDYLNNQREKYEKKIAATGESEVQNEVRKVTDIALKNLCAYDPAGKNVGGKMERAYNQACEEAVLNGVVDDNEIEEYARTRMTPAIESVVVGMLEGGRYDDAIRYMEHCKGKISRDDWYEIGSIVYEEKAVNTGRDLLLSGDTMKAQTYLSSQSERVRLLAEMAAEQTKKVSVKSEEQLRRKAVGKALNDYNNNGRVRGALITDGRRVRMNPEDYLEAVSEKENSNNSSSTESAENEKEGQNV